MRATELLILTLILTVLTAVGHAHWQRLRQATATAEAVENLTRIQRGAAIYLGTPHTAVGTTLKVNCQFPATVGTTPQGVSCCDAQVDADDDERCDAKPQEWTDASWLALKFRLAGQHWHQYEFASSGTLINAKYTAQALGDLDCDGLPSTFRLVGKSKPGSSGSACDVQPGAFIERFQEWE